MLDGLRQVNGGTVYIATTNHPEKLESHFKNRPGRFDIKRRIGLPTEEARFQFFFQKLNDEQKSKFDLRKWAFDTNGLSLAHLKELIISVVIMNKDYEKSVAQLKRMADLDSLRDDDQKIGF